MHDVARFSKCMAEPPHITLQPSEFMGYVNQRIDSPVVNRSGFSCRPVFRRCFRSISIGDVLFHLVEEDTFENAAHHYHGRKMCPSFDAALSLFPASRENLSKSDVAHELAEIWRRLTLKSRFCGSYGCRLLLEPRGYSVQRDLKTFNL